MKSPPITNKSNSRSLIFWRIFSRWDFWFDPKCVSLINKILVCELTLLDEISIRFKVINLPNKFSNHIKDLTASKQFAVNIGVNRKIPILDKYAWLYIPDPSINVYRIGNYSFASKYMAGSGAGMSLYLEISSNSPDPIEDAKIFLKNNFLLNDKDISCLSLNSLYPAYVHFKNDQGNLIEEILNWLKLNNIYSIGRYGSWDYISMEDCIKSASLLAKSFK